MANPFTTSTTYVTDNTSTGKIKYTNSPSISLILNPGELGFNFASGVLSIGSPGASGATTTLIDQNNSFVNFLTSDISLNQNTKVPTARSVRQELDKKADLSHSNKFTGMNEFPYLRIIDAAPSQVNMTVTIKMLQDYLTGDSTNSGVLPVLIDAAVSKLDLSSGSKTKKFIIRSPLKTWDIDHGMNSRSFTLSILDVDNNQHDAPYTIIDENRFQIHFSVAIAGEAVVIFA